MWTPKNTTIKPPQGVKHFKHNQPSVARTDTHKHTHTQA